MNYDFKYSIQFLRRSIINKLKKKIHVLDKVISSFKGLELQPFQEHKINGNS